MPIVNPGQLRHWVTLDDPVPDGTPVTFVPARVKVALMGTGQSDENRVVWTVQMRYHQQVTFNTRITLDDARELFVRGIENVGDADRSGYLTLTCEEVLTP